MRIVFWNICAGGGLRAGRIAARLTGWAPDVAALCEFRGTPPSLAVATALAEYGLTHQCTTATGAANGLLLASRWPLRRVRGRAEPVAERGRWLLAEVAAPRPFAAGVMHVPNRAAPRRHQLRPPRDEDAPGYYRAALAVAGEHGMRPLVAHCHLGLGKLARRTGKREQAQGHLRTATIMYREMDSRFWQEQAEVEVSL